MLVDIEKMIKQKLTPTQLTGFEPAERGTGERRRREGGREGSRDGGRDSARESSRDGGRESSRDAGRDSSRSASSGRSAYSGAPRKEKVDPWFLKPYEPSVTADAATSSDAGAKSPAIKPGKSKMAALLGGTPKR